ncbi:DUF4138 domain-containing protein [Cellulophaga omnivescoria]|uniref:DUF4138 domain-containing protein n=1 Tax=Cellulophaga omnivescoria TaxID=1888890 RepID=UPI000987A970|nr:DUF4138 domain-containing protein [Cellulophaga omnivescoria]
MKTYIIYLFLIFSTTINAQRVVDTIYANEKKNVALFFSSPIRQGITGTVNFVFTYNREQESYFGLLQATPGTESNLLTITSDGKIYSYILKYKKELQKLNYFIAESESIGNENPEILQSLPVAKSVAHGRIKYFQKFSDYLLRSSSSSIARRYKKGIKLQLEKMVYAGSEVYLAIEVKNKSGIDFEIDYLTIYRTNGNKKRKASYQKLPLGIRYKHKMETTIKDGESSRFIYVLPKFVLGDNERLEIELKEAHGSRKVILKTKV